MPLRDFIFLFAVGVLVFITGDVYKTIVSYIKAKWQQKRTTPSDKDRRS